MQKNRAIIESFNKGGAAVVGINPPEEGEEVSDMPFISACIFIRLFFKWAPKKVSAGK